MSVRHKCEWMDGVEVSSVIDALGGDARFVGGCVRDSLLGLQIGDIDIATPIEPEEVMQKLKGCGIKVKPTGLKYGTVTAIVNKVPFEITTLRCDLRCDGRHVEVSYTDDWREDAKRRDFTFNAISCSKDGEIFDYFGGVEDLENGVVRFVGDAFLRCQEDVLRILRFFRFSANFAIDEFDVDALDACKKLASQIELLSGERIWMEMYKLLVASNPLKSIAVMQECGVGKYVFLSEVNVVGLDKLLKIEGLLDLPKLLGQGGDRKFLLRLAVLLMVEGLSHEMLNNFVDRWRLSNVHKKMLFDVLLSGEEFSLDFGIDGCRKLLRKMGKDVFVFFVICHWVVDAGCDDAYVELIKQICDWQVPKFEISGKDLVALGVVPGKEMGEILLQAENWWEDKGYAPSREEILAFVKGRLG